MLHLGGLGLPARIPGNCPAGGVGHLSPSVRTRLLFKVTERQNSEVGPKAAQSWPKVGPKAAQRRPKVGPKSAQSRPKGGPKSVQSRPKGGPKSTQRRPKVGPKSARSRLKVGPKSVQAQSQKVRISTSGPAANIPDATDGCAVKS